VPTLSSVLDLAPDFRERLLGASSVLIGSHLNPDGDALGSSLAVSWWLDAHGVRNTVVNNNPAPYNLRWLPGVDRLRTEVPDEPFDLGVILDLDSLDRLGRLQSAFAVVPFRVVVDHHIPHEEPGELRLIDPHSPATSLILADIFHRLREPISKEMATCLLTGIVTDTGSFRYRNTTPGALAAAGRLVEQGGDIVEVCEEVYQKRPLPSLRLLRRALDNMRVSEDQTIAWAVLTEADFRAAGAEEAHTEGLVNDLLFVDGIRVAALIRQPPGAKVRASLRSREGIDVTVAARQFCGGGHRNAAGCTFEVSIEEAERLLMEALQRCSGS